MGDCFDLVADTHGLPRPAAHRASRGRAHAAAGACCSFMSESRRLDNARLKRELGVRLRYPTVHEGLQHMSTLLGA